ncbi:hypothetical protein MMC11_008456 [Xylographa trunciseda]|nr:hypothetical protein [Xylographa trunciseda]
MGFDMPAGVRARLDQIKANREKSALKKPTGTKKPTGSFAKKQTFEPPMKEQSSRALKRIRDDTIEVEEIATERTVKRHDLKDSPVKTATYMTEEGAITVDAWNNSMEPRKDRRTLDATRILEMTSGSTYGRRLHRSQSVTSDSTMDLAASPVNTAALLRDSLVQLVHRAAALIQDKDERDIIRDNLLKIQEEFAFVSKEESESSLNSDYNESNDRGDDVGDTSEISENDRHRPNMSYIDSVQDQHTSSTYQPTDTDDEEDDLEYEDVFEGILDDEDEKNAASVEQDQITGSEGTLKKTVRGMVFS